MQEEKAVLTDEINIDECDLVTFENIVDNLKDIFKRLNN